MMASAKDPSMDLARSVSPSAPSRCLLRQAPASIVVGTFIVFLLKLLCQNCILRLTR